MADVEISDLPSATPTSSDLVPIQQSGVAKRSTISAILGLVAGTYYAVGGTDVPVTDGGTGSSTASGARTNLGLVIGTDVQAYSSVLAGTTASFTTADETKLDGIETAATADQSDSEIETAYNNQVSVVSQAIAEAGTSTTVYRWTPQRVAQAIAALESAGGATNLTWTASTSTVASDTGTDAVLTAVDGTNPGLMTSALKSKLDGIEAAADVTDATNVAAAGAHMAGGTDVPVADGGTGASTASAARTNLGLVIGTDVQAYSSILAATTASYTTALNSKLSGIETAATADQSDAEIETAYNNQVSTVSQVDAEAGTSTTVYRWTPQRVAQAVAALETGGASAIDDLSDVTITTPSTGQVLKYNGSIWTNQADATGGGGGPLEDATDVTITSKDTGDLLRWNGSAWVDYADSNYATSGHNHSGTYHEIGGTDVPVTDGGTGASTASGARTNLGLVIGTDVQAQDAELSAIAGLTSAADGLPYFTGSGTASLATFTAAGRALVDDASATAQRTTLGLGSLATASTINDANWSGTALAVANGGTGSTTAANARTALGLGSIATQASSAVTITGGSVTGITDLAVADGGTGASTAANARTNLGLGSLATASTINDANWSGTDLAIANGGTGSSTAATARTALAVPYGNGINEIRTLSQATYDGLSPDANTLYLITS